MKVLFQSRTTLFSVPGGDTTQLLKTKEYLEQAGVRVDISTELNPDLTGYDLVHLFNIIRPQEVLTQARNARRQGKKVALSTIYVDYSEYERRARRGILKYLARSISSSRLEYLKTLARAVKNREFQQGTVNYLKLGHRRSINEILQLSDVLLPNSDSEMNRLAADFPAASQNRFVTVPNAVDVKHFDPVTLTVSPTAERFAGCVLCVGRIEGRKCQLELVRAMKGLPWQLVLIGTPAPNHMKYFQQIVKEAGPNVHILGAVDHHRLAEYYLAAKVHVLVSWMETTGLSSLEAGVMGCNLVITKNGDTTDYFGDYADYCEPDSVDSIREAIVSAYSRPRNGELREHILKNYTWQRTAEKTLEGYRYVLGG